jgi:sulfatase-like protein
VRGASPGDVVVFAVALTLAAPIAALLVLWLVGLVNATAARAVQLVCVAGLLFAIALQLVPPVAAVALALAGTFVYARLRAARVVLTVLGPAPLVMLALFLASGVLDPNHPKTAPVVVVMFDEFPVHSLMAADGRVDARLYPNFARLAGDATWYRNTASVDQDTPYAVPAILDGRLPRRERLPVAADHPRNIFSLFADRYALHVREDATTLCAPVLCGERAGEPLWEDIARVYAHELFPDDFQDELDRVENVRAAVAETERVPRETKRRRYVRIHRNLARRRPVRFERFVDEIEGGRRPRLHLIHILLPHVPYQYLPSGDLYRRTPKEAIPGLDGRPGYGIPFLVEQSYQRHLLQLQNTDRLLGELLDRLHELGIYKRALIAVVADHGMSFRLGHDRRLVRPGNVQDLAPVPFFLKAPGQERGRISDRPLQTIDVLPTIADIVGVEIPWKVDGRSALEPPQPRRRTIVAKKFKHTYPVDTPGYERARRAALRRKLRLFGDGIYRFGPRPDLLGERVPPGGRRVSVDRGSGFVPAHVAGTIAGGRPGGGRTVAVAVNGRVVATGVTFTLAGADDEQYSVIVPERAFRDGANRVELLFP